VVIEKRVSPTTRVLWLRPNSVFALMRWSSSDFGTVHSRIDIMRSVGPGEPYSTAPYVQPGGDIYLS
jgi:hypothetical protein